MSKDLEKIFNEKFRSFTEEPRADLFDSIIAARKKRRAIGYWSIAAVLVMGIGLSIFWFAGDKNEVAIETPASEQGVNESETVQDESTVDLQNDITMDEESLETEAGTVEATTSITTPGAAQPTTTQQAESTAITPETEATAQDNDATQRSLADLFNDIVKNDQHQGVDGGTYHTRKGDVFVANDEPTEDHSDDTPVNDDNTTKLNDNVEDLVVNDATDRETKVVDVNNEPKQDKEEENNIDPIPTKPFKWYAGVEYGAGFAGRTLNNTSTYADLRNGTESARLSHWIQLNAGYRLSDQWSLQSGLIYTHRNEQFAQTIESEQITEKTITVEETIIHPVLGEITREIEKTVYDTTTNRNELSHTNQYTSISIPLYLERNFYLNDRWSTHVRAGFDYALIQNAKGQAYAPSGELTNMEQLPFRTSGLQRVQLGLGLNYRVNERLSLSVYPQANMSLNSQMTINGIKQREFGCYTPIGFRVNL